MGARFVIDYLEWTSEKFPDKLAFIDENRGMTFREVQNEAKKIAMSLIEKKLFKKPIAIFMEKRVECVVSFMGIAYSGNFYTVIDTQMPVARIEKIIDTLNPATIITNKAYEKEVREFFGNRKVLLYEEMMGNDVDNQLLVSIKNKMIDTDILYILFTSGSTGVPKGVILSHRAVTAYVEWGAETFQFDESTIFGNQTPFYFIMSIFDIYQTLRNACTMYIIPKKLFSFPVRLLGYMQEHKINTVCWVPSVLCLIANFKALPELHLEDLKTVIFGGEVMPAKQLNMWRREYSNVQFVQTYGQTEMCETCVYYNVERELNDEEPVPIGYPCNLMDIMVLNGDEEAKYGEIGELCGRGPLLSSGYYNDAEKTAEAFVQNPLNPYYPEIIYRTGDLVRYNEYGELVYVSRKDCQIKHMGNRIELGEIETVVSTISGVDMNCCLYDDKRSRIILMYVGEAEKADIYEQLKLILPVYMLPHKIRRLDKMPFSLNGKIDRKQLKELIS